MFVLCQCVGMWFALSREEVAKEGECLHEKDAKRGKKFPCKEWM